MSDSVRSFSSLFKGRQRKSAPSTAPLEPQAAQAATVLQHQQQHRSEQIDRRKSGEVQAHMTTSSAATAAEPTISFVEPSLPLQQDLVREDRTQTSSRSIFRVGRRKKTASVPRESIDSARSLASVFTGGSSTVEPKRSFQLTRNRDKRPTLSANASSTSLGSRSIANSLLAVTSQLISPASPAISPRYERDNPLERLSRQHSVRSIASQTSARSNPAINSGYVDRTMSPDGMRGRGRSMTHVGHAEGSRTLSSRSSRFFTLPRLRKGESDMELLRRQAALAAQEDSPVSASPVHAASRQPSPDKVLPEPVEGEKVEDYLTRLDILGVNRSQLLALLSLSDSAFCLECLTHATQRFDFSDEPLDMSLRRLLMDAQLPRETQQIDRVLTAFAKRYHDCNPSLYDAPETPYVLSFALIMLHTDRFNQNNKNKMTKAQFIRNTTSAATANVGREVLDYFYDNVISTPFTLLADDTGLPSPLAPTPPAHQHSQLQLVQQQDRPITPSEHTLRAPSASSSSITLGKRSLDLHPLIAERKLEVLRPPLNALLSVTNELSYAGTLPVINVAKLHASFLNAAILQLVSARSRPEAYVDADGNIDPLDTEPGVVDVKVYKIGILKKKEQKRPDVKGSYREWGVFLTGAQLLLFKNVGWVKHYMQQVRDHTSKSEPCRLEPPWSKYAPDTYFPVGDAAAIYDSSSTKKLTQFAFLGRGGDQTLFVASSEDEMNDWVAKINYAAALHTSGTQVRDPESSVGRRASGDTARRPSHKSVADESVDDSSDSLHQDHAVARRTLMRRRIKELETKIADKQSLLVSFEKLGHHLTVLTPIQSRTRSTLISAAGGLAARRLWTQLELVKYCAHRDLLKKDLELELDPTVSPFTSAPRSMTPTRDGASSTTSSKLSPSKSSKLNSSVMANLIRQASTDTLKRIGRRVGSAEDLRKRAGRSRADDPDDNFDEAREEGLGDELKDREVFHLGSRSGSEISADHLQGLDFTPATLDKLFQNSPMRKGSINSGSNRPETAPLAANPAPPSQHRPKSAALASSQPQGIGDEENRPGSASSLSFVSVRQDFDT
ncbi:hypothetical protein PYCC9005_000404 [Savitreella phatthalungensis]